MLNNLHKTKPVQTNITGFIGVCEKGSNSGNPVLISSFEEFNNNFGSFLSSEYQEYRYLAYSIEQYFKNGGKKAYVVRVENNISAFINIGLQAFHDITDVSLLCAPGITSIHLPPSGILAGVYVHIDETRGVHKSPANDLVTGCVGVSIPFGKDEQDVLYPKGINLIRDLSGNGIRVWGASTLSNQREWKQLESSIQEFLYNLYHKRILAGNCGDEAFYINIGNSSMTYDDIVSQRLICKIGVAIARPSEFYECTITQQLQGE